MSKQKKPHSTELRVEGGRPRATKSEVGVDPDLAQQTTLGNQALAASLAVGPSPSEVALDSARTLADGTALALRVAPRDPAWTSDMVGRIARSALSDARKQAIIQRLQGDQQLADAVGAAVEARVGTDNNALRAVLVSGLDAIATLLAEGVVHDGVFTGADGQTLQLPGDVAHLEPADVVAAVSGHVIVDAWQGQDPESAVRGLVSDLSRLVVFSFDEEEEEELRADGDYAIEESGA